MEEKIRKSFLYYLIEPSGEVKYVGQTLTPYNRYYQHCSDKVSSKKQQWIKDLSLNNKYPFMVIFDTLNLNDAIEAEGAVIKHCKSLGLNLVNGNLGRGHLPLWGDVINRFDYSVKIYADFNFEDGIYTAPWVSIDKVKAAKLYPIQAYVTDETKQALRKLAAEQDRSESYVAGNILNKGVKK